VHNQEIGLLPDDFIFTKKNKTVMMEDDFNFKVVFYPSDLTQFWKKKFEGSFLQMRGKRNPKQKKKPWLEDFEIKKSQHDFEIKKLQDNFHLKEIIYFVLYYSVEWYSTFFMKFVPVTAAFVVKDSLFCHKLSCAQF